MRLTTTPLNIFGQQQALVIRLVFALVASGVVNVLLGGVCAWQVLHGQAVYFIPPGGPGLAQPGMIPDGAAIDYATRWLETRYTFTPAQLKARQAAIRATLHPRLSVEFDVAAEKEAKLVKDYKLSNRTTVLHADVTHRAGTAVMVTLDALREVMVGDVQTREEPLHGEITVVPWLAHGQAAGMVVVKVTGFVAVSASGQ